MSEVLKQFAEKIVPELKQVSGRFADSIESTVKTTADGSTLEITASPYITTLIDGRKPTSPDAKKGDPTLQEILLEWIKSKSITPSALPNEKAPTLEELSWLMAKSIHAKGDLLYQRGGKNNRFEAIITQSRIDALFTQLSNAQFIDFQTKFTL
jgi:hypothetical protein